MSYVLSLSSLLLRYCLLLLTSGEYQVAYAACQITALVFWIIITTTESRENLADALAALAMKDE